MIQQLARILELHDFVATSVRPIAGGDINHAYCAEVGEEKLFLKCNPGDFAADMFGAESEYLTWLGAIDGVRTPKIFAAGEHEGLGYLILEYLPPCQGRANWGEFGSSLGKLHRAEESKSGVTSDGFIGRLPQNNAGPASWPEFYCESRIEPLVRLAVDDGVAPSSWVKLLSAWQARIAPLLQSEETPRRLHGDLWSGNVHFSHNGLAYLIDPAAYAGDREVDLAMLQLFGSPPAEFWASYDEVCRRRNGYSERVKQYQLYPLLVHANLFGGHYVAAAATILAG